MAALPKPSFDPKVLLPMPKRAVAREGHRVAQNKLLGQQRALLSEGAELGVSMASLRSGRRKKSS